MDFGHLLLCLACAVNCAVGQNFDDHLYNDDDLLLPDELPSTHPDQSPPIFLEMPIAAYATRSKPATLTCRAAHALHLYFECAQQLMTAQEHSRADYVDPQTAIRQLEVKLDVDARTVEDYFGDYSCVCVAWSSRGEKRSPSVKVTAAYLQRHFPVSPTSQTVHVDQPVELSCSPPDGDPQPTVTWQKNRVPIDAKLDPNYIVSKGGNLLIAAAKLSDMANYSCVAENVANKRSSQPAKVTVYVDGGWTVWSAWSPCSPLCGAGRRHRQRTCSNPAPLNGGRPCRGPAAQTADCSSSCPAVDGGWSAYSDWSACDVTCRQSRQRSCSDPAPVRGGRPCQGADREHRNCTQRDCDEVRNSLLLEKTSISPATRAVAASDVTLYVSLALALLLFPLVFLVAIKLYRRKGRRQSVFGLTDREYEAKYFDNASGGLGKKPAHQLSYTPDLTSGGHSANSTPPSRVDDFSYNIFRTPGRTGSISENHYAEPLLPLARGSTAGSSATAGAGSQRSRGSGGSSGSRERGAASSASSYCSSNSSGGTSPRRNPYPSGIALPGVPVPARSGFPSRSPHHQPHLQPSQFNCQRVVDYRGSRPRL